jgi:hypothetical protein
MATRLDYVKGFAERFARTERMPAFDTVTLEPPPKAPQDAKSLPLRFVALELRLAKPSLDGACIDPRVTVRLVETADASGGTPGYWLAQAEVRCETEPATGTKPPESAAKRALPKAASGAVPFLAMCESVNFAMGGLHSGEVIDRRGDVYRFTGGPVFSGSSAHELAVLVRHQKVYVGTLPPADVDRLVALTPAVEREPLTQRHVAVFDAPAGSCTLLRAGASPDALVSIPFETFGRTAGARTGVASTAAKGVLERAWNVRK